MNFEQFAEVGNDCGCRSNEDRQHHRRGEVVRADAQQRSARVMLEFNSPRLVAPLDHIGIPRNFPRYEEFLPMDSGHFLEWSTSVTHPGSNALYTYTSDILSTGPDVERFVYDSFQIRSLVRKKPDSF